MQNINSDFVSIGTKLIYQDAANFQKWTVKEIFDGGFLAVDEHEEKDFWFDRLQNGWSIDSSNIVTIDTSNSGDLKRGNSIVFIFENDEAAKAALAEFPSLLETAKTMYPDRVLAARWSKRDELIDKLIKTRTVKYSQNQQSKLNAEKWGQIFGLKQ
ncbi:hypothetical protein [Chamaesiphon sp.]|uniref:hypothetical protein n=1 Tax=Chamaesiphon sp. TaxID=2814140 RepID=UPI0035943538